MGRFPKRRTPTSMVCWTRPKSGSCNSSVVMARNRSVSLARGVTASRLNNKRTNFPMLNMRIKFALVGLSAFLHFSRPALAQQPLATLQYRIAGIQLQVSPAAVSVPKGIAGSILAQLTNGDGATNNVDPSLANGAYVEAILRGPAFPA